MTTEMTCPLCDQRAQVSTDPLVTELAVRCDRCGAFAIGMGAVHTAIEQSVVHILSGLVRRSTDSGVHLRITEANLTDVLSANPTPNGVPDQLDLALQRLGSLQVRIDEWWFPIASDVPYMYARDVNEMEYLVDALVNLGLIEVKDLESIADGGGYRVTPRGWERIQSLRSEAVQPNRAFVAMWFTNDLKSAWDDGFKPALDSVGFDPVRIDLLEHNDKIDDRIIAEIRKCGLVVADFTGHRGGVYFEAGFAMGLGIPVIWCCRRDAIDEAHFDTRQFNHIVWTTEDDLRLRLVERISATIAGHHLPG